MYVLDFSRKHEDFWVYKARFIASQFCFLVPLAFLVLMPQPSTASANGGVCKLKSLGSFSNTVVDVVSNAAGSATSRVDYECNSPTKYSSVQFCLYIRSADGSPANSHESTFYQTQDTNARLAWLMKLAGGGNEPVAAFGGSKSTIGWTHYTNWSPGNHVSTASQQLILTYLERQQQDRARSGLYSNTYQLITQYKFSDGVRSSCNTGIANPDGTIITSFTVTAAVTQNCQLENLQDIDFGTQDSIVLASKWTSPIRAYGNVGIRCTYQTPYSITISKGNNAENKVARMKNDNNFLPYQLFQQDCKAAWDNQSALSGSGNTVNAIDNHQVCAQIMTPLAIAPAAGTYVDTVIVTATF